MSYSRWSNSVWYTYYCVSHTFERDLQLFDVCDVATLTYGDLKNRPFRCLKKVWRECPKTTKKEMQELIGYMKVFLADVESDINVNAYMKIKEAQDWELPTLIGISRETEIVAFLEERMKNMNTETIRIGEGPDLRSGTP